MMEDFPIDVLLRDSALRRRLPTAEDGGYWMLDTGCQILDAACWMRLPAQRRLASLRIQNLVSGIWHPI